MCGLAAARGQFGRRKDAVTNETYSARHPE
jgi:hypothetical protein